MEARDAKFYALSQPAGFTAAMVYPCDDPAAREARVEVRTGAGASKVALRPLYLPELLRGVQAEQEGRPRELAALARRVAFGDAGRMVTGATASGGYRGSSGPAAGRTSPEA